MINTPYTKRTVDTHCRKLSTHITLVGALVVILVHLLAFLVVLATKHTHTNFLQAQILSQGNIDRLYVLNNTDTSKNIYHNAGDSLEFQPTSQTNTSGQPVWYSTKNISQQPTHLPVYEYGCNATDVQAGRDDCKLALNTPSAIFGYPNDS